MGGDLKHSSHGGGTRGAPWLLAKIRCLAVIDSSVVSRPCGGSRGVDNLAVAAHAQGGGG